MVDGVYLRAPDPAGAEIRLTLLDMTDSSFGRRLYPSTDSAAQFSSKPVWAYSRRIKVANQIWAVHGETDQPAAGFYPWLHLFAGLALVGFITATVYYVQHRAALFARLVQERTEQVSLGNQVLLRSLDDRGKPSWRCVPANAHAHRARQHQRCDHPCGMNCSRSICSTRPRAYLG